MDPHLQVTGMPTIVMVKAPCYIQTELLHTKVNGKMINSMDKEPWLCLRVENILAVTSKGQNKVKEPIFIQMVVSLKVSGTTICEMAKECFLKTTADTMKVSGKMDKEVVMAQAIIHKELSMKENGSKIKNTDMENFSFLMVVVSMRVVGLTMWWMDLGQFIIMWVAGPIQGLLKKVFFLVTGQSWILMVRNTLEIGLKEINTVRVYF
jgi:hypothetical protein